MIFANCYYVTYQVADFAQNGETTWREDPYQSYDNALLVAKEIIKCRDVFDGVCIIDGLTGEVLDEFSADDVITPTVEKAKEETVSTIGGTFKDKNGGIWRLTDDGNWDYDCTGRGCSDCVYCNDNDSCDVTKPLCEEDRNYQIELAQERMRTKTEKNDVINNNSFEDGFGGVWHKDENELWYYDCHGMYCYDCPYFSNHESCRTNDLSLDDAKKRITEAKERIGK